jgi:hypothetical protein
MPPPASASRSPLPAATPRSDRRRHRPLLAPFDLSRLRATLSSHSLTPRRLVRVVPPAPPHPRGSRPRPRTRAPRLPAGLPPTPAPRVPPALAAPLPTPRPRAPPARPNAPPLRRRPLLPLLQRRPLHARQGRLPRRRAPCSCTAGCSGTACRPPPSPSASPRALCRLGRAGDALAAPRDGAPWMRA